MIIDPLDLFLAQASARPEASAIAGPQGVWTYGHLAGQAWALAKRFAQVVEPKVMVVADKQPATYAALLAAGLAGGFYAPAAPSTTAHRLRRIAEVLEPDVIFAPPATVEALGAVGGRAIWIDSEAPQAPADAFERPRHDLAYVIFTSGSTGEPKGVCVQRPALAHYIDWLRMRGIGPGDRLSQHPPISFDISVTDIYGALCFGAALYPFDGPAARLMAGRKVRGDRITVWNSTPSVISLLMQTGQLTPEAFASVRQFQLCGEPLMRSQLDAIFTARPDAIVYNTYGPTEATVSMTCRRLTADSYGAVSETAAPLGEAIAGMRLDLDGADDEGEIVITGPQVAAGYWRDPRETQRVFGSGPHGPTYRTGDLARRRGGELYFLGRRDGMIKIRGHRLETGEVAAAFAALGWNSVCVFMHEDELCAAVETGGRKLDTAGLKAALGERLEAYAVPARIAGFDQLPRNSSDKISLDQTRAQMIELAGRANRSE